jgi:hypothetical protein
VSNKSIATLIFFLKKKPSRWRILIRVYFFFFRLMINSGGNECTTDNGGCDVLTHCHDTPTSFTCGPCPNGYTTVNGTCVSGSTLRLFRSRAFVAEHDGKFTVESSTVAYAIHSVASGDQVILSGTRAWVDDGHGQIDANVHGMEHVANGLELKIDFEKAKRMSCDAYCLICVESTVVGQELNTIGCHRIYFHSYTSVDKTNENAIRGMLIAFSTVAAVGVLCCICEMFRQRGLFIFLTSHLNLVLESFHQFIYLFI